MNAKLDFRELERIPRGVHAGFKMSYSGIERRAERFRAKALPDLDMSDPVPGHQLFSRIGRLRVAHGDRSIPLEYAVNELPQGTEGMALYDRDQDCIVVALSACTYDALERNEPRAVQTLGHELGHAILHTDVLVRMGRAPHRVAALMREARPQHKFCEDTEWMANAFSAALLAPARALSALELVEELSVDALQTRFNLSVQGARNRLNVYQKYREKLL